MFQKYITLFSLIVVSPNNPEILEGSKVQVTADEAFNLTCRANGGKPAGELTWHDHSGSPVDISSTYITETFEER